MTLAPFDIAAIEMLRAAAGVTPKTADVIVLADDLQAVVDELDPNGNWDPDHAATQAVRVLRERIGGFVNLKSYLATLHAGKKARR